MDNCYDIILEDEDYTLGKVIEYLLYEELFVNAKTVTYCGFKKVHPHNTDSIIRLAYAETTDKRSVAGHVKDACLSANKVYQTIHQMFAT
jgi:DNA-directed RNA polymerase subunit L